MKGFHVLNLALGLLLLALIGSMKGQTLSVSKLINDKEKVVALTFDDGPDEEKTEDLLDMLREKQVPATFFVIGAQVEENEELVKRMAEEGHQIGIHTWRHVDLSCLSEEEQREEIEKSRAVLVDLIGERDFAVRPPFGQMNAILEQCIEYPMILWSIDTEDWTGKSVLDMTIETAEQVRDGDIILMHDISENSIEGAKAIIDELERMGYTFLTIEELFFCKEITLENGRTYRYAR